MTYSLEQHIEELRAELVNCADCDERLQIEAELAGARQELAYANAGLDVLLSEEPPS
jgi:H2-forming N5,N10-methylenetetrahydromethanopterin dehydrogenase-like enzyme